MTKLTSMKNIGKELAAKLNFVGINSAEELIELGSKQVFLRLKIKCPNVCLVHLYSLEGAICGIEFNNLADDKKKELKVFSDSLKK